MSTAWRSIKISIGKCILNLNPTNFMFFLKYRSISYKHFYFTLLILLFNNILLLQSVKLDYTLTLWQTIISKKNHLLIPINQSILQFEMYRTNLIKFAIQIRRQKRSSKVNDLRSQFRHSKQIQSKIDKLLHISVNKQNYCVIQSLLNQINSSIIILFSKIAQSADNVNTEQDKEQLISLKESHVHQGFLKNSLFRRYLLKTLESVNLPQIKSFRNLSEEESQLLNQLFILIGLIMKQPQLLVSYFPFKSFAQLQRRENSQSIRYGDEQKIQGGIEDELYQSFELMQQMIFYLKHQFWTLGKILSEKNTFLTLIHSLTRIFQHFTQNSVTSNEGKNMARKEQDDSQTLNYLYQLLKSNTFQLYFKQIMMQIIDSERNTTKNNNQSNASIQSIVIDGAIVEMLGSYMYFVHKLNPSLQLSQSFIFNLLKYSSHCLKEIHHFNSENYLKLFEEERQQQVIYSESECDQFTRVARLLCLRMLFSLHNIISHQQIEPSYQLLNSLCMEIMLFLHNVRVNSSFEFKNEEKLKLMYLQNQLNPVKQINSPQFYLDLLVSEQQNIWFTELQLLGCLYNVISTYNISLEQLFKFTIDFKSSPLPIYIDTKFISSLLETVCQSTLRLSGTFFNQRHLFIVTIVYLFCYWYEIIENEQDRKKKKYGIQQKQFTINFMIHQGQTVLNYLQQLKSNITTSKQMIEIPIYQTNPNNYLSSILTQNCFTLQTLTDLKEMLEEILQQSCKQNNQIEI